MKMYTIKQVALMLNEHERTIRSWINTGKLKGIKKLNGRGWLVEELEIPTYARIEQDKEVK